MSSVLEVHHCVGSIYHNTLLPPQPPGGAEGPDQRQAELGRTSPTWPKGSDAPHDVDKSNKYRKKQKIQRKSVFLVTASTLSEELMLTLMLIQDHAEMMSSNTLEKVRRPKAFMFSSLDWIVSCDAAALSRSSICTRSSARQVAATD